MKEIEEAERPTLEHANGSSQLTADQELVYRLKSAIDQKGRYAFRLNDMAAGFAAGQNISNAAARRIIEERFTEQMGTSPQEYLDRHYQDRNENRQEVPRTRQPKQDRSR